MRNALRQLTLRTGSAKTAGRNSQGRITSFHRGGGAKRLQRIVDLKRSTSAMGIVERIEYDPNRSSRLALVRWVDGVKLPRPRKRNNDVDFKPMGGGVVEEMGKGNGDVATPSKVMESTTATIGSYFSCSALLPEKVEQRKVHCVAPSGLMAAVGAPNGKIIPPPSNTQNSSGSTMKTSAKDVFVSALSSSTKGSGESNGYLSLPRIAVAGAKPTFFTPQLKEEVKEENNTVTLCEVRKWTPQSIVWSHRIKPKAALSWLSFRGQESLGLVGATDRNLSKLPNTDQGGRSMPGKPTGGPKQDGSCTEERTPVSYIIASDQLEVGKMVMNCDWSKSSTKGSGQSARSFQDLGNMGNKGQADWGADRYEILDLNSQIGNCIPLTDIRIGTWVHDIECKPGQGAKMVRAAGTSAKVVKEPGKLCTLRLPSGAEKIIDSRCRATVGKVSNINHDDRKLRKAGHSRWLGRRPVVRGVAMNPVDHPHGGGEGRTKGGRPSVSPWGKPTKAGYKTAGRKRR